VFVRLNLRDNKLYFDNFRTPHLPVSSAAALNCQSALDVLTQKRNSPHSDVTASTALDQLASACTGISRQSKSAPSSVQPSSKASSSRADANRSRDAVSHRKPSTTCGKITSGVGPLSHHGPSGL